MIRFKRISDTAFYLLIPVFPLYLIDTFGASKSTIGIVLSSYTVAALLIRPVSGFVLDNAGYDIGCIVPTIRMEGAAIGGEVGVHIPPTLLPASRESEQVEHRGRVRENTGLLVARLVKPFNLCRGCHSLYGTGETTTSVVALDGGCAGAISAQHLGHLTLRNLHRLTGIDRIADVDYTVGIHRITERAEIVIARVGSVGVVAIANDISW